MASVTRGARKRLPTRNSADETVFGLFEETDGLLDRRKTGEKVVDGLSSFKIIKECLNWHPSARKNRGAAHYFGVAGDNWRVHAVRLLPTLRPAQP